MNKLILLPLLLTASACSSNHSSFTTNTESVTDYHLQLVQPPKGIGAREAGSAEEKATATFIFDTLREQKTIFVIKHLITQQSVEHCLYNEPIAFISFSATLSRYLNPLNSHRTVNQLFTCTMCLHHS